MASMRERNGEDVRVVVTAVGAVTAQGPTATDLWEGVKAGRVAIRKVAHMSMEGYRTELAGEVPEVPVPEHDYPRPDDFRERALDFAMAAAEEAYRASGVGPDTIAPERWGVVMGTCNAGLLSAREWFLRRRRGEPADPVLLTLSTPQGLAEAVGGAFGVRGPTLSVDTACAAGANAVGYGADLIRLGRADAVIAGGTDALSDFLVSGFNSLQSLSPEPAAPYSRDRKGLSLGEGAGVLLLVREDIARAHGLPILAEVLGYGLSADGYHPTAPHPEGRGAARAIKQALRSAGVEASDVQYVNSHGTGTDKNDPAETRATRRGLGEAADGVAVSSTKSMIGHLLGAAGAAEAIVTVKAILEQIAPPTANFTEPDPECDLDYVPNEARPLQIDVAVSNNFAFGGANASVVLAREGARPAPPVPPLDRVVVTGLGAVTALGTDLDTVVEAVREGRDATNREDGLRIARVDLDPSPWLSRRDTRRMDRLGIFAVVTTRLALEDAALDVTDENGARIGVVFGTGIGPMDTIEQFSVPLWDEGPAAANPALFPNSVYNAAGGQVALRLGTIGAASTVTAGHAAGVSALCYGYDLVAADHADAIACSAADTLTDTIITGYRELGLIAGSRADAPDDGFGLAEAGVTLVLERLSAAQARDARILGEVLGYGMASDGLGVGRWDPEGTGTERAIRSALESAGLKEGDVTTVLTGACGYELADAPERAALQRVFGGRGNGAPELLAPKQVLGESIGVGGALCAAMALRGWQRGASSGPTLVNSSSLGGAHFSLVVAPFAP